MTEYDEIMYLDSDMVVRGDVTEAFDACGITTNYNKNKNNKIQDKNRNAYAASRQSSAAHAASKSRSTVMLCAVQDHGAEFRGYGGGFKYFNAGVLILKPRRSTMALLMANKALAEHHYSEQNLLNAVFQGKWQQLPYRYNALKFNDWSMPKDALLVHQKSWHSTAYCIAGSIRGYFCCSCAFEWAQQLKTTRNVLQQLHLSSFS